MCEATVILQKSNENEELMKEVEFIEDNGVSIKIIDIMGRELDVNGRIVKIDLVKNRIFISE